MSVTGRALILNEMFSRHGFDGMRAQEAPPPGDQQPETPQGHKYKIGDRRPCNDLRRAVWGSGSSATWLLECILRVAMALAWRIYGWLEAVMGQSMAYSKLSRSFATRRARAR